jgi:DNA-binding transcriptional LysR family regulator
MDKLRYMEIFVRIVETGSLTAAARSLGMSGPAVVRSLASLEGAVGVRLLNRTTRKSSLSDEGREYLERCKRILADVEEADAALSSRRMEPRGRLRLTAPVTYGRMHVAPVVSAFAAKHHEIEVDLLLLDRVVDLVEEGIDAAIRIGSLPDSSLVAVRLGETSRVICAAPAYLRREGTPKTPDDLPAHRNILFTGLSGDGVWSFGGNGQKRVSIRPFLRTNHVDAALDACLRGHGCSQFLAYQVKDLIAAGKLNRLLTAYEPAPLPIHLVYPHSRLLSANVRVFIDAATSALRNVPLSGRRLLPN